MVEKEKTTAAAPVSEFEMLKKLSEANKVEKNKRDKTPEVDLPELAEPLYCIAKAAHKIKDLKAEISQKEAEIFPILDEQRRAICQERREFFGSVKVNANTEEFKAGQATYTTKNQYPTGIGIENKDGAIAAIAETMQCTPQIANVMFDERMQMQAAISIKPESLKDPKILAILTTQLKGHLKVKFEWKPTKKFHEDASLSDNERKIMECLLENKYIKGVKPSIRVAGAPEDDEEVS